MAIRRIWKEKVRDSSEGKKISHHDLNNKGNKRVIYIRIEKLREGQIIFWNLDI